eukprot:m.519713 g.519713  ORF g.519713 m.519713 type:complete len:240 (+) comp21948_c0_seq7:122-841(+)
MPAKQRRTKRQNDTTLHHTPKPGASTSSFGVVAPIAVVLCIGVVLILIGNEPSSLIGSMGLHSAGKSRRSTFKHFADAPLADPAIPQEGVIRPLPLETLQRWNPVAVNYTRELVLDDSGRTYTLRTMAMDPPIFEIEGFLTNAETNHLMKLANRSGFIKSDHTFLDGSNYDDKDKDTSTISTEDEANKLFRYSDQTCMGALHLRRLQLMYSVAIRSTRLYFASVYVIPSLRQRSTHQFL